MGVTAFTFDPAATDAFVRLGFDLYRGDPRWVPPLEAELRSWLAPGFAFHRREGSAHRRFLARAAGRPVARVLASVHPDLRDRDGTPVGAVGLFEAEDDPAAADDVLGAALEWLRAQGRRRVWGPMTFDIWHGYRLMTRGFEEERHFAEPYNKRYYAELFARSAFRPRKTWSSFAVPAAALEPLAARGADAYDALRARGYRFESFAHASAEERLTRLHEALSASFAGFLGYTPLPFSEFRDLAGGAWPAVDAHCSTFVYDEFGRLAAFGATLVDIAPALRAMRGSTSPLARLRFRLARRRCRRVMMHLGGLTPGEARRHARAAPAAFHDVLRRIRGDGHTDVLATLVARGNPIRRHYGACARDPRREYTLLQWDAA